MLEVTLKSNNDGNSNMVTLNKCMSLIHASTKPKKTLKKKFSKVKWTCQNLLSETNHFMHSSVCQ